MDFFPYKEYNRETYTLDMETEGISGKIWEML